MPMETTLGGIVRAIINFDRRLIGTRTEWIGRYSSKEIKTYQINWTLHDCPFNTCAKTEQCFQRVLAITELARSLATATCVEVIIHTVRSQRLITDGEIEETLRWICSDTKPIINDLLAENTHYAKLSPIYDNEVSQIDNLNNQAEHGQHQLDRLKANFLRSGGACLPQLKELLLRLREFESRVSIKGDAREIILTALEDWKIHPEKKDSLGEFITALAISRRFPVETRLTTINLGDQQPLQAEENVAFALECLREEAQITPLDLAGEKVINLAKEFIQQNPDVLRHYLREIEALTSREIPKNQRKLLKECIRSTEFNRLSPNEYKNHRTKFSTKRKDELIAQWEEKTEQKWPTYIDKKGEERPCQAHHIIKQNYGGPHEWWNIHPAALEEHQGGIHGKDSYCQKIFEKKH
jgi:hypothetical protein